jgi:hypothetical protein
MTNPSIKNLVVVTSLIHWLACVLGTLIIMLFFIFAIAQEPPFELLLNPQAWMLSLVICGFVIVWWNDILGGAVSVAGIVLFYFLNILEAGIPPSGWVFPLCFLNGLLAIAGGIVRARFVE